jgi:hypothetical protein
MATLDEMKTRIRLETNKDDIGSGGEAEAALTTAITQAIEYYADEPFWFNHYGATTTASATTSNGVDYVAVPATLRWVEQVALDQESLIKVSIGEIEERTDGGRPTHWAATGDIIALWPVPDGAYALTLYGVANVAIPGSGGASNIWTTEAYDLITARAKFLLYRDLWRDTDGVQYAAQAEGEALTKLRRETRRRTSRPLRSTGDEPWTAASIFNINRGDF